MAVHIYCSQTELQSFCYELHYVLIISADLAMVHYYECQYTPYTQNIKVVCTVLFIVNQTSLANTAVIYVTYLCFIFFKIRLNKNRIITRNNIHSLHSFFVCFIPAMQIVKINFLQTAMNTRHTVSHCFHTSYW